MSGDNYVMETEKNFNNTEEKTESTTQTESPVAGREETLRLTRKFMQVSWLLNRFLQRKRSEVGPMGDPHRGQGRILALLKLQPGISQSELAYLLGMRPQSAGELLAKLERAGLIERTQSETDKRVLHVKLTAEGEKAAEQRDRGKGAFSMLDANEKETLSTLLQKVADGLEEQVGETPEDRFGRGWKRGRGERGWGSRGPEGRGGPRRGPDFGPEVEMYFDMRTGTGFGQRRGRRGAWGRMPFQGEQA